MTLPAIGTTAPDFTAETDAGTPLTLSMLRGRAVVLFFYPRDNTLKCTIEACAFRDTMPRFDESRAMVVGISPDSVTSHRRFKARFGLTYPLLADTDHTVCKAYGVWQQKSLFGFHYLGVRRTTFVIDRDGVIAQVFKEVKTRGHAAQVMEVVGALP